MEPEFGTQNSESRRNTPPPPGWKTYVPVSILVLLPVYWQPRLQASDLSVHIYNAWLAKLIEAGRTEGLEVVRQSTNILFDLILSGLLRVMGAELAQRIAVSLAVLTFVWGAFRFISVVAGRRPWHLLPCIAMLAYGWVFHMGFFNFYLSLGLCFWALSLVWDWKGRGIALAAPLLLAAYLGHAIPVVWMCGLLAYLRLARGLSPRGRSYVTAAWLLGMVILHAVVGRTTFSQWSPQQIRMSTGADQLWVFDGKYYFILIGLLAMWGLLFLDLVRKAGPRQVVSSIPFQFCVISAAGVFILPTTILIPGFQHNLVYLAERMSLGVGICVCALVGAAIPKVYQRYAMAALAAVFFSFLFRDERALNAVDDRMNDVISQAGPGQPAVSAAGNPKAGIK